MSSYDEIPYPLVAHSQTHPTRLATLARLHNLTPTPVEGCRVLEVGCAQGGNLIPIALELSQSEFIGIDLSHKQIETGRQYIEALGLKNIRLLPLDLLNFDSSYGEFDYIVAHGLYSWAPEAVQQKLFEVCQKHLTPNGIAFISFNTYPGWKTLSLARDLMLYHTRETIDPLAKADQGREVLESVVQALTESAPTWENASYAHAFYYENSATTLRDRDASYITHEYLESINAPVYFHEFAKQAGCYGLQYVADVQFRQSLGQNLPPAVSELLNTFSHDRIEREQYLDFLTHRAFRQVLLCHEGLPVEFKASREIVRSFRFASPASLQPAAHANGSGAQAFAGIDETVYEPHHPLTIAAWKHLLDIWPQSATFEELLAFGELAVDADNSQADTLADDLLGAFLTSPRLMEFTVHQSPMQREVSEKPTASPWARLQAQQSAEITTLRHERYTLNTLEGFVLLRLDGTHTVEMIVDELMLGPFANAPLEMDEGEVLSEPEQIRVVLAEAVAVTLSDFARLPLLVQ